VGVGWLLRARVAGRRRPGAAGFGGGDDVEVIVTAEDVALRGEAGGGAGEGWAGGG
jgi:hypothetical protein